MKRKTGRLNNLAIAKAWKAKVKSSRPLLFALNSGLLLVLSFEPIPPGPGSTKYSVSTKKSQNNQQSVLLSNNLTYPADYLKTATIDSHPDWTNNIKNGKRLLSKKHIFNCKTILIKLWTKVKQNKILWDEVKEHIRTNPELQSKELNKQRSHKWHFFSSIKLRQSTKPMILHVQKWITIWKRRELLKITFWP